MKKMILPQTYFIILLVPTIVLYFTFPTWKIITVPYTYLGGILIAFGAVLDVWADQFFKKGKTTVKPNEHPSQLMTYKKKVRR